MVLYNSFMDRFRNTLTHTHTVKLLLSSSLSYPLPYVCTWRWCRSIEFCWYSLCDTFFRTHFVLCGVVLFDYWCVKVCVVIQTKQNLGTAMELMKINAKFFNFQLRTFWLWNCYFYWLLSNFIKFFNFLMKLKMLLIIKDIFLDVKW